MSRSAARLAFEASTTLAAGPGEVFDFHQNPANIPKVMPALPLPIEIEASPVAREGETFRVGLRLPGARWGWVGRWATVVPGRLLVDVGEACPFSDWRHEHIFEEAPGGGTLMTDKVGFLVPGGRAALPFWRCFLRAVFAGRHAATRRYFRGESRT